MPDLVTAVPARVLAIYAHPDDPEVSCGGTLARWAAAGAEVHVVVCTQGDKGSSDPSVDPADAGRAAGGEEAERAGVVLGVRGHHFLDHPDGEIENTLEVRAALVAMVRTVRPEVVVCPDPDAVFFGQSYFNHHDHRVVGWATLDAVAPAAANPHYFPDAGAAAPGRRACTCRARWSPTCGSTSPTRSTSRPRPCSATRARSARPANGCGRAVRERAEEAGRAAGVAYAEGFRRFARRCGRLDAARPESAAIRPWLAARAPRRRRRRPRR